MFGLRRKWSCPFDLLPLGPYLRLWGHAVGKPVPARPLREAGDMTADTVLRATTADG